MACIVKMLLKSENLWMYLMEQSRCTMTLRKEAQIFLPRKSALVFLETGPKKKELTHVVILSVNHFF